MFTFFWFISVEILCTLCTFIHGMAWHGMLHTLTIYMIEICLWKMTDRCSEFLYGYILVRFVVAKTVTNYFPIFMYMLTYAEWHSFFIHGEHVKRKERETEEEIEKKKRSDSGDAVTNSEIPCQWKSMWNQNAYYACNAIIWQSTAQYYVGQFLAIQFRPNCFNPQELRVSHSEQSISSHGLCKSKEEKKK